ncbi:MAG TPA: chaperonin GroEL [Gammaproteobacteria bacterium]|nr:chaperonin GroEL [Gammaproteobacteria bacterium]
MSKILRYRQQAREALGRGIEQFVSAVDGTIGPKGGNGIIDIPLGTPVVSRDGVRIASEIELDDPFENMGVQVVREVSRQTNTVAGDGTTTAAVLANAIVQGGLKAIKEGANPVDLVEGMEHAGAAAVEAMRAAAKPLAKGRTESVASVAANSSHLGSLVADAVERVGATGIIDIVEAQGEDSSLEVVNGFTFDRGYVSHHLATETDTMEAVLERPRILLTDAKIKTPDDLKAVLDRIGTDEPLAIIAQEFSGDAVAALVALRDKGSAPIVAVHPPEFGRWRESMMEDIAVLTGGRFICAQMGRRIEDLSPDDLGVADELRATEEKTIIVGGAGDLEVIDGRREQVVRQLQVMEQPVERDKLEERLAQLKAGGGKAIIYAGGYTGVECRRREQLIEDSINATRHAVREGVVPGGGMALVHAKKAVDGAIQSLEGDAVKGAEIVGEAALQPLRCIATNAGADADEVLSKAVEQPEGNGFNAARREFTNLIEEGVLDPVKVPCTALENAVSVSGLILATKVLIADKPEIVDPTAGPARGGGAEELARDLG